MKWTESDSLIKKQGLSDDAYNTFFNKDTTKTCFFLNKEILLEKKNKTIKK